MKSVEVTRPPIITTASAAVAGRGAVVAGTGSNSTAEAIEATRDFGERIEKELKSAEGDQEAVVKKIFREDYVEGKLINQEERPFVLNLTAQVKAVVERAKS